MTGNGIGPGAKALRARCRRTDESLPTEYSRTGRAKAPAASLKMPILSASSRLRYVGSMERSSQLAALRFVTPCGDQVSGPPVECLSEPWCEIASPTVDLPAAERARPRIEGLVGGTAEVVRCHRRAGLLQHSGKCFV